MFTGLIEELGVVRSLAGGDPARLTLRAPMISEEAEVGDSVSINGVCLTVTSISRDELTFDIVRETLSKSNLASLTSGDRVNLERPLTAGKQFGGHFVLGHVDGIGKIRSIAAAGRTAEVHISASDDIMRYVVPKGSIAVDGISLTVASVESDSFTLAIIPHTLENTNLREKRAGAAVNLEADIIGKYVEKFVGARRGESVGLTEEKLRDAGFVRSRGEFWKAD